VINYIDIKGGNPIRKKGKEAIRRYLLGRLGIGMEQRGVFTWSNRRSGSEEVKERLDMAFVNEG
ncbi:OLC1v1036115C1, partial [Oldenlandia corymbosa var. corymbosa]